MIAYEIQLWYVIRDKIQSGTKFEKKKLLEKNSQILSLIEFCLDFQCAFLSCLRQIDAYYH